MAHMTVSTMALCTLDNQPHPYSYPGIPRRTRPRAHYARRRRLRSTGFCAWLPRIVCLRLLSLIPPLTHDIANPIVFNRLADVKPLMWGYKVSREIARRMPHFRGEYPSLHPSFSPGPASVIAHAEGTVALNAPRVMYSEEDERALEAYVRKGGVWNFPFFCLHIH